MESLLGIIAFIMWVASIWYCRWAAGKMGKRKDVATLIGLLFWWIAWIGYGLELRKFNRNKNKQL